MLLYFRACLLLFLLIGSNKNIIFVCIIIAFKMTTEDTFDQFDEEEQQVEGQSFTKAGRKRLFSKELRCMMYGFGDDENPYTESVDILEDLVIEFLTEMTHSAMEIGRSGRVQVEDIVFLVRKDAKKYARVKELLMMNEELKKARKAFDEGKFAGNEVPPNNSNSSMTK